MTDQDLLSGVDFSGIASISGADLMNGIGFTIPLRDGLDETQGRGLPLVTTDTALNVPAVPNPTASALFTKWKRFIWLRRPFAGAPSKAPSIYLWNDDAVLDATYLKWVAFTGDLSQIEADVADALATAQNAVTTAQAANNTAVAANNTAANAQTAATNAVNTANTANANVVAAQTSADNAGAAAAAAQTTATSANTLATSTAAKPILNEPNTAYNRPRVNAAGNAVEWYNAKNEYVRFSETQNKGVDGAAAAAGKNTRVLNTTDANGGNLVTLNIATGVMTFQVAGTYRIRAWGIMNRTGANPLGHVILVVKDSDNSTLLTGAATQLTNGNGNNSVSAVEGIITAVANQTIRLDHYTSTAAGVTVGLAANVHPDAGGKEVYAGIELTLLGT